MKVNIKIDLIESQIEKRKDLRLNKIRLIHRYRKMNLNFKSSNFLIFLKNLLIGN